jgi:hypothetical protein
MSNALPLDERIGMIESATATEATGKSRLKL